MSANGRSRHIGENDGRCPVCRDQRAVLTLRALLSSSWSGTRLSKRRTRLPKRCDCDEKPSPRTKPRWTYTVDPLLSRPHWARLWMMGGVEPHYWMEPVYCDDILAAIADDYGTREAGC